MYLNVKQHPKFLKKFGHYIKLIRSIKAGFQIRTKENAITLKLWIKFKNYYQCLKHLNANLSISLSPTNEMRDQESTTAFY